MKIGYIIGAIIALAFVFFIVGIKYSQKFTQDSNSTATKGILFKKTLNLEHYKRVSNGLGAWGNYDNYSRSDRHGDVITVYCNDYCSKDK